MKTMILIIFSLFLLWSCTTTQVPQQTVKSSAGIEQSSDSSEYELIVIDPGFENWFLTNKKPIWNNPKEFYEYWNRLYITEWNHRCRTSQNPAFDTEIMYDSSIDYGTELNHKLYHYFIFFQKKHNIQLIENKHTY